MKAELTTSPTGAFWHIVCEGEVINGAPKRGHGSATKAEMLEWLEEINATLPCDYDPSY
jgi:hypothetical protein